MHVRRTLGFAALAATIGLSAPACSGDWLDGDGGYTNVAYTTAPAAWGPPGICYFLYSPLECSVAAGLTPVVMPTYWHARYESYYDHDPRYRDRIPTQYRDRWESDGRTFARNNRDLIRKEQAFGDWKDTKTNKTVSGPRPAQVDKTGKPITVSGSASKTVDKTVSAKTTKKDSWGFKSSSSSKSSSSKSSWGFSGSSSSRSGSSGRRP